MKALSASQQPTATPCVRPYWRWFSFLYATISAVGLAVLQIRGAVDIRTTDPQYLVVLFLYWLVPLPASYFALHWRKLWKRTLLLCISGVIVPAAILETAGRVFLSEAAKPSLSAIRIPSRRLHHTLMPNSDAVLPSEQGRVISIRSNEDGLRTGYSRSDFLGHDIRIAALGDSFTFGFPVGEEDAIPAVIERALHRRPSTKSLAVLNAGFIGYSPIIERQLFHDVVSAYRPTVTLLLLDISDIGDDWHFSEENVGRDDALDFPYPESALQASTPPGDSSITLQLFRSWGLLQPVDWLRAKSTSRPADEPPVRFRYYDFKVTVGGAVETNRDFVLRYPLAATRPFFERTLHFVRMIRDEVEKSGSRFVLVLLPRGYHWNNKESPDDHGRNAGFYTGEEPYRFVFFDFFEEAAAKDKMTVLNLLPAFRKADRFPLCFKEDSHYNPAGCEIAGTAIAEFVVSGRFTPGVP